MRRILIASSKGGCGKTTVATNLAAALAQRRRRVWLIDADAQGSSAEWVQVRDPASPPIGCMRSAEHGHDSTGCWTLRVPPAIEYLLVDTPAGLRPHQLSEFLRRCDTLLVPIMPSAIDMRASHAFLVELAHAAPVRTGSVRVGLIANRVKARTIAARDLNEFSSGLAFPLIASLRDTQAYVLAAAFGRGVFDYGGPSIATCHDDWLPVLEWLDAAAAVRASATASVVEPTSTSP